ncbi:MAG TPA: hypothetical protein VMX16_13365, partial [Terriglobia bacterium]|nr:hypothetical protein [Terriglobia bacterium]
MVLFGGGVRLVSSAASVAGRLPVPGVRRRKCLDDGEGCAPMRRMSTSDLADRWHNSRRHSETVA